MSRRTTVLLLFVAFVLLNIAAGLLWFIPSGTGEYRQSPDGRYTAHAMNMKVGNLRGGWDRYIEIWIVDDESGREVWRIIRRHTAGEATPDYGIRGPQFIAWATDSSSVAVPVIGGKKLVLAVPQ